MKDKRYEAGSSALRNDDFEGSKYFPLSFKSIMDTDLFKTIPQQESRNLSDFDERCILVRRVHGKESINQIKIVKI